MWLLLRPLSLNGRRVIATIMASNHKRLKMSENASCSTIDERTSFYLGTSDFSEIVKSSGFVDKTLMLKEVLHGESFILITAPRRFAKSTNIHMVKKFVEIEVDETTGVVINREESPNRKIFNDNNLLIFQDQKFFNQHFATYPVIHANFKNIAASSYDRILNGFRHLLMNTYWQHRYLLKSQIWSQYDININTFKRYYDSELCDTLDEPEIVTGFQFLSKCLYYHFDNKKVFVLIDEYDGPIYKTVFEENVDIHRVNVLLGNIFSNTFKNNEFVERALLTGISYFGTVGLSGADNIQKCMFLGIHPFVKYYGLIESEVDALLSKFKIDDKNRNEVKLYYYGYTSRENIKLYSFCSVLKYLNKKQLKSYWEPASSTIVSGLTKTFRFPLILMTIEKLLKNEYKKIEVFDNINLDDFLQLQDIIFGRTNETICNPDLFWNFLVQQGYLTYEGTENSVRITNKEARDELAQELFIYYNLSWDTKRLMNKCSAAFNHISLSDIESFQEFVETFESLTNMVLFGTFKLHKDIIRSLLYCVIGKSQFQVCDNVEYFATTHRPDLIVVKGKNACIIEIIFKQSCKKKLREIIQKRYYTKFDSEEFKDLEHKGYLVINVSENLYVSLAVLVNTLDINKAVYF